MLEEERKYDVDPSFELPDLSGVAQVVEQPEKTLRATYYDTPDLRLARAGVSLRYRRGDAQPWTVKLPSDAPGVRHEISRRGAPSAIPVDLEALVTVWRRGSSLAPVTVLRSVRRAYELCSSDGDLLAELADDTVTVLDGRRVVTQFREIEVERKAGNRKLLDHIESALGATPGEFVPKHIRALGPAAAAPPDLPAARDVKPRQATAGDVVTAAVRRAVARILNHDPLVRLRAPVGDNDTAVHQMRVGCRRLRSDLRTFKALVDPDWAASVSEELKWLADQLGAARDAEVLRERLRATADADPLAPLDEAAVARMDASLEARHDDALAALDKSLASDRYVSLVDTLLAAAQHPQLAGPEADPATGVLPKLVAKPWRRLAHGDDGAGALDPGAPDERWHAVRIRGKRARYAVEAVAGVLGGPAVELGRALAHVQELLGEHQDAAVAAETWLAIAQSTPDDHELAVTAGRLCERERASIHRVRAAFPEAWRAANRKRLTDWLP
jgi:CHAD domain-containing protein